MQAFPPPIPLISIPPEEDAIAPGAVELVVIPDIVVEECMFIAMRLVVVSLVLRVLYNAQSLDSDPRQIDSTLGMKR